VTRAALLSLQLGVHRALELSLRRQCRQCRRVLAPRRQRRRMV
jgi:hypothetical protein